MAAQVYSQMLYQLSYSRLVVCEREIAIAVPNHPCTERLGGGFGSGLPHLIV